MRHQRLLELVHGLGQALSLLCLFLSTPRCALVEQRKKVTDLGSVPSGWGQVKTAPLWGTCAWVWSAASHDVNAWGLSGDKLRVGERPRGAGPTCLGPWQLGIGSSLWALMGLRFGPTKWALDLGCYLGQIWK